MRLPALPHRIKCRFMVEETETGSGSESAFSLVYARKYVSLHIEWVSFGKCPLQNFNGDILFSATCLALGFMVGSSVVSRV